MARTTSITERRDVLGGVHTRILEVRGGGPPLVLLHGFSDSADTWRPLLERLAVSGRSAIAFDLPGFGTADAVAPGAVYPQFESIVAAVVARVTEQARRRPVLVGNSLGGAISMYVANRRSSELAGIVPVCTAGLSHPLWVHAIAAPVVRTVLPLLAIRGLRRPMLSLPVSCLVATARTDELKAHVPRHVGHLSRARLRHQLSIVRRLLDEQHYPLDTDTIACPVMCVFGACDRAAGLPGHRATIHRLARRIPGARLAFIDGCGHLPQLEAPDTLGALLQDFAPASTGQVTDLRPPSTGRALPPSP